MPRASAAKPWPTSSIGPARVSYLSGPVPAGDQVLAIGRGNCRRGLVWVIAPGSAQASDPGSAQASDPGSVIDPVSVIDRVSAIDRALVIGRE